MKTTFTIALLAYFAEAIRDNGMTQLTLAEIEAKSRAADNTCPIALTGPDSDDQISDAQMDEEERRKRAADDTDPSFNVGSDGSEPWPENDSDIVLAQTEKKMKCWDRAETRDDPCFFKSAGYQAMTRQDKLSELWEKILPGGEESGPAEFDFSTWPRFFKQNANGSFCQNSDEQKPRRVKTIHVQGLVA